MTTGPTDVKVTTAAGGPDGMPLAPKLNEGLGALVRCPMCGANDGYALAEGSTHRWWLVVCIGCGRDIGECRSNGDARHSAPLPARWSAADAEWNAAGEHAQKLRIGFERYETARRMNPSQWADAWNLNISTGKGFDEIVDDLRPFLRA